MKELRTEIEIRASADDVWNVLTEFDAYIDWNPFITRISGKLETEEQLEIRLEPPGGNPMTFRPYVQAVRPPLEFRWLGRLLFPGVFDGEHIFQIESISEDRVRFVQRENFSGLLVPFLWKSLDTKTRAGFEGMNRALKERVEVAVV